MTSRPPRYSPNEEKRLTAIAVANMAVGVLWIMLFLFGSRAWWLLLMAAVFLGGGAVLIIDVRRQRAKRADS